MRERERDEVKGLLYIPGKTINVRFFGLTKFFASLLANFNFKDMI